MTPASITLTTDELLVFLSVIGVASLNGLDTDLLTDLSGEETAARLNVGEHSLVSRGLLTFEGEEVVVLDDTMTALVGSAVIPSATLMLCVLRSDGASQSHFFSSTPELMVEHFAPRPGIFWFGHMLELESIRLRLQTLMAPFFAVEQTGPHTSLQMNSVDLAAFVGANRENRVEAAVTELIHNGYPEGFVRQFASDYHTNPAWVAVTGWGLREKEPIGSESVMVVPGVACCWLVENVAEDKNRVNIRSTDGNTCEAAILQLLQALTLVKPVSV